jgi:hypothetical protein
VVLNFVVVAGAVGLCDEAGGGHAEEAEGPEDGVEKDAAQGDSAERCRAGEVAGEDRVHCGEQWLGQVRQDQWDGEQEDAPVPVGHWVDFTCEGHRRGPFKGEETVNRTPRGEG